MIKRHWMSICLVLVFFTTTGILYYFYPHTDTNSHTPISSEISLFSKSDEKGNSGTTIPIESVQTGSINTNTGTQNKTHSGFIFQKPNTEWKERDVTLNDGRTLHYVFGEGNPKEVLRKKEDMSGSDYQEYFHESIIRPKTERFLKEFLSNPMLITVMEKCGYMTVPYGSPTEMRGQLPGVLFTTDISMESMLSIDMESKQKWIDSNRENMLSSVFSQIKYGNNEIPPLIHQCLSENEISDFDHLYSQFLSIGNSAANDSDENIEEVFGFLGWKIPPK